jgi:hypothetical protein
MPTPTKPAPTAEESALKELVNAPELVTAFGKTYAIGKFTLGPMTRALEYVGPMGYLLKRLVALPKDKQGRPKLGKEEALDFAVTAISISGPSVLGLIGVATNEPPEFLEVQDPMEGLAIFVKVVEKNLDFFTQQNFDKISHMFGNLLQQIPTLGGGTSTT